MAMMLDDITTRLSSLGYNVVEADTWMIAFFVQKVSNHIKSECNLSSIPDALNNIAVDMVVGEFLSSKKDTGQLREFNFDAAIKQIEEGDTSVTYAFGAGSLTPEQRFDALLGHMMNSGKSAFASYRRFKW